MIATANGLRSMPLGVKAWEKYKSRNEMVRPERFELPTYWFVASRSIQLSYGRTREVSSETIDRISGLLGQRNCGIQGAGVDA